MASSLKISSQIDAGVKAARGLAYDTLAYAQRPGLIELITTVDRIPSVELKPGEPAVVAVALAGLPRNANVRAIAGTLTVLDDSGVAEPEQAQVVVQKGTETPEQYQLQVATTAGLRNVEIRLDQGAAFWSRSGNLAPGDYDLPDFAAALNDYLDKLPPPAASLAPSGDAIPLRFRVKSDTAGHVRLTIKGGSLDYSRLQTEFWENPHDQTLRLDRSLDLDFGVIATIPLRAIQDPGTIRFVLARIRLDVGGRLGPERLLGSVEVADGREFATVSGDYSLAQRLRLDTPVRLVGVCGSARNEADREAELYLEVQNEEHGAPAAAAPLARTSLKFPPSPDGEIPPFYAAFEAPCDLKADVPYWLILKGIRGKVLIGLQADSDPNSYLRDLRVNRGGQLWKALSRTGAAIDPALVRLVYLPGPDNQTSAVELGVRGTPARVRIEPTAQAQTVVLDPPDLPAHDGPPVVLEVRSHARGSFTLTNVIQEYQPV